MKKLIMRNLSTIILSVLLIVISTASLFIGVLDINIVSIFFDEAMRTVFFSSRLPRL